MLPWLLCDYNQSERKMTLPKYRIMVLIISLFGLVVPIFQAPPVFVMIISQAFNSTILPVTVACILYLGNRKDLMGEFKNKMTMNIVLGILLVLSTFTTYKGVIGVIEKLGELFG